MAPPGTSAETLRSLLPEPPGAANIQPIALHGREIYAVSQAREVLVRGPQRRLAFEFNLATDGVHRVYRYDGNWTELSVTIQTSFEFPGTSSWSPLGMLATGPGTYALLGQVSEGQQGTTQNKKSVAYRTGNVGGLSDDDHTMTPVEDTCTGSCQSVMGLIGDADDGTFFMQTSRGGPQDPVRIFTGNRSDLR